MPQSTNDTQGSDTRDYQNTESDNEVTQESANELVISTEVTDLMPLEPPLEQVVAMYLTAAIDSDHTRRAYSRHLRNFQQFGDYASLSEVAAEGLAAYRAHVCDSELSPGSQAQALAAVRGFLGWARTLGGHRISADVVRVTLRTPKATVQTRYSPLNEREIARMFEVTTKPRDKALLAVLLGAGLRVAEAAGLDLADVFEDPDGGLSLFVHGKGSKDRSVPLGADAAGLVTDYVASTKRYLSTDGPVFIAADRGLRHRRSRGLTTRTIAIVVKIAALRAGITAKRVSPHSLRHSFALRCLRSGGNVVAVSRLLGHASLITTQRYVDHLENAELRSAVPPLPLVEESTGEDEGRTS